MLKLVNLTPHPVVVFLSDGRQIVIEPSGVVARVKEVIEDVGELVLDERTAIPLRRKFLSSNTVEGLPAPAEGTIYIVSFIAAQVAWAAGRTDVVATGDPVRDEQGRIVGITSFYVK